MSVHKQSGKKNRKHGRGLKSPSRKRYRDFRVREHNKLKNVLKSNGEAKALEYAREHNLKIYW